MLLHGLPSVFDGSDLQLSLIDVAQQSLVVVDCIFAIVMLDGVCLALLISYKIQLDLFEDRLQFELAALQFIQKAIQSLALFGKLEISLEFRFVLLLEAQEAADLVMSDLVDDGREIHCESAKKDHVWMLAAAVFGVCFWFKMGSEELVFMEGLKIDDEYLAKFIIKLIQLCTVPLGRFVTDQRQILPLYCPQSPLTAVALRRYH